MAGDRLRLNLRMKFLALNVNFSSPSLGCLRKRAPKTATPLKSGYFAANGSCSVKTVADRHRHAAFHNKQ